MTIAELLGRCSFPDGHLHLGVSGGADSVAMAVLARSAGQGDRRTQRAVARHARLEHLRADHGLL